MGWASGKERFRLAMSYDAVHVRILLGDEYNAGALKGLTGGYRGDAGARGAERKAGKGWCGDVEDGRGRPAIGLWTINVAGSIVPVPGVVGADGVGRK